MNAGARAGGEGESLREAVRMMVHAISNLSTEITHNNACAHQIEDVIDWIGRIQLLEASQPLLGRFWE